MTLRTVNDAAAASAALTAFLRGVERRAAVFAWLQMGDAEAGDTALASALADFARAAANTPFGDWPRRFWSLLLATPALHELPSAPAWPPEFRTLALAGHGPRAALLLRLVANVSEADAAAALGVSRATYRLALQRALPRHADGTADAPAWRALGEAAQQAVRQLPPERLAELARLREAALQGPDAALAFARSAHAGETRAHARWLRPALAAVVALTVAAVAATFLPRPAPYGDDGPDEIVVEPLPPPPAAAATYDAEAALLTHPDFELLVEAGEEAAMRDPAFHAWLAAQLERGDEAIPRPSSAEASETDIDPTAMIESDDAP